MTKEEILKKAEEDKAKIDKKAREEIAEIERAKMLSDRWKPNDGDVYYTFFSTGDVFSYKYLNEDCDKSRVEAGTCFKTREEAEEYVNRLKYLRMYEEMGRPFKPFGDNIVAFYDYSTKRVDYDELYSAWIGCVCFDTKDECKAAVQAIGEKNFKRYILGIKERQKNDPE